ncbi:MAG TPA: carboxypeptidase-like regulatory domain-containing protein [Thermoanaerobaculia bacterium]|jgi:hypothetical protein
MKRLSLLFAILLAGAVRAADVTGFVFREDNVVEGVPVQALVPVTGTSLGETVTGKDGGFAFTGLPDGVIEVKIDEASWLVLGGDVLTVNLLTTPPKEQRERPSALPSPRVRGEATVSGTVTLNGKPLANAPVIVQGLADRSLEPLRVVTNAKGQFRATGLEPLRYAVVIDDRLNPRVRMPHSGKMYAEGQEPFIVDLRKAGEAAANVELTAAPVIRGRVVDAEGKPVGRARVLLTIANRPVLDFVHRPADRTTPDGRYAIAAPEWSPTETVNVAVTAPLRSTFRSKAFPLGTADRTVDIALPKLEPVQVRVTDRAGKPVADARVAFAPAADGAPVEMLEVSAQSGARANAAGEVTLHLAPDAYDFVAAAKDFQTGSVTKRIAKAGTVDVMLERAATLRGRVHRGDRGVPDVHVTILSGSRTRRDASANTDAEGKFEIGGLAPGPYRLGIFQMDQLIDRTMEVEAPGNVDVALPPAGTLQARVIDAATGGPVREFAFSVEPVTDQARTRGPGGVQRGQHAEDGTFRVTVPVGTYRVTVGAMGYTSSDPLEVRVTEEGAPPLDIPLGRGISVTGRVTDEAGLPIAEADVMVVGAELQRMGRRPAPRVGPGHARSAEDGTFTITGVEAGEAQMTVRKQGYVAFRKSLEAEGPLSIDVKLVRGMSLPGIVTRGGKPVAGAQISASTSAVGGEHQNAVSGEDGRFVLTGLVPARYTVSAFHEEQQAEVREVDPARQKEVAISLDPKPRGIIYGTVTGIPANLGGKYVQRSVSVQSPEGGADGPIDEAGNYRIENAPLGSVIVMAHVESSTHNSRSSVRRQVELAAGQPLRVDLELSGNVRVTGRVTHEGKPLPGAHVGFSSEDGTTASAMTRDDGGYEIALPAAGRYHIYARAEQISDRHFQTVREVRGGETIDIDLREQIVEGTVVDAVTRQPIANAIVTLAPAMNAVMSISGEVPTDANGRFRMTTSGTGTHRLVAAAPGYAYRSMPVVSNTTHYAFELQPAAELRVRVVDSRSGTPLEAHLMLHEAGGAFVPGRVQRSGDGTSYGFSLPPGKYKLTAVVHGYTTRVVEVTAPGTIDVAME